MIEYPDSASFEAVLDGHLPMWFGVTEVLRNLTKTKRKENFVKKDRKNILEIFQSENIK